MSDGTGRSAGDEARWVVRHVEDIDVATAARAARGQAGLADGLALLRAVRFPLLPAPVEPATGDRACEAPR